MGETPVLNQPGYKIPALVLFKDASRVFKLDSIGKEILQIALPAALALAADPIASLIDTAFIGHIGPVELAAVGVSIAIFNQASRVTIFPLVSITTSFVAEEDTMERINNNAEDGSKRDESQNVLNKKTKRLDDTRVDNLEKGCTDSSEPKEFRVNDDGNYNVKMMKCDETVIDTTSTTGMIEQKCRKEKRNIPSASTALVIGTVLGLLQALLLVFCAKPLLSIMGIKSDSPMLAPAQKYLTLRSLGAPAVLLSLATQGIFRGFKDTKTPLYATVIGDILNVILDAIFIFILRLGVSGAAIAHVLSQYLILLILLWKLMRRVNLMPPSLKSLQFSRFLKNGFMLLARVIAVTFCVTLAASMAARLGPTPMAAFQISSQVWLTSSLLADGLAVAGQAILASAFAENDYSKVTAVAARVLQMGFILGLGLVVAVGSGLYFGSGLFSRDPHVIHLITLALPFVAATQPINTLAFVFDGVNFGASDFAYTAYSMVIVAIASILSLIFLSKSNGFIGIWIALTIYMALRMVAGIWRMGTGTGPWKFLKSTVVVVNSNI